MTTNYSSFVCIHAFDESTKFLDSFQGIELGQYCLMIPSEDSITSAIEAIESTADPALIIFLGHGYSSGLYSPKSDIFPQRVIIDSSRASALFREKDVILLSCRSAEFIKKLTGYRSIMGFGNIISSTDEILVEADQTGEFRKLSVQDVESFNAVYVDAIIRSVKSVLSGQFVFQDLARLISYFINKEINRVLKDKSKANRVEIARLLFEFRNEMCLIC